MSTLERLAPLSGVVFIVLLAVGGIIGGEGPDADDTTAEVIEFWTDEEDSQIASALVGSVAVLFLVWFAGSLRTALRRAEGEPGRLAALSFAGFLIAAIGFMAFNGFQFAAADTVGDVPEEVTQTLSVLYSEFWMVLVSGVILGFVAAGLAILRHGGLPRWLGYAPAAIVVLSFVPPFFLGFLVAGIWILVASVLLYREGAQAPATTGPPA